LLALLRSLRFDFRVKPGLAPNVLLRELMTVKRPDALTGVTNLSTVLDMDLL
jgi:hypothetical protein